MDSKKNLSVATNFDEKLLYEISRLNDENPSVQINEVYGSLPLTSTGGGRSAIGLPNVTRKYLKAHVKLAHDLGLRFNYLLNGYHPKVEENAFDSEMDYLESVGINAVTLSDRELISMVSKKYPSIEVQSSLILGTDTKEDALDLSQRGAKVITLNQFTINRNLAKIKDIREVIAKKGSTVKLYSNISCLDHCPKSQAHYSSLGKSSKIGSEAKPVDKFLIWCMGEYYGDPVKLLKSPFIRPEALELYYEAGISNFKLSDRREPTEDLVELFEAYSKGEFHGNLFDLLFRHGRKWSNSIRGVENPENIGSPRIVIDNDTLTDLDFDRRVTDLEGEELEEFYDLASRTAVSGVDSRESLRFRETIEKLVPN